MTQTYDETEFRVLGKPSGKPEHPDEAHLETIPNLWPDADYEVTLSYDEFASLCPVTSRPDFGQIVISYMPRGKLIEGTSLTTYLESYRNYTCFHEFAVNKICNDLGEVLEPEWLEVKGDFRPRGAIAVCPVARWKPRKKKESR